ncbi:YraN family protein [Candidatus Peregrinibacteria bacterium]|nr:YraN family protein [Candidatus Peregrinibacteria bacterium]
MPSQKSQLGTLGENYAESYLVSRNYLILCKNYRCRFGEIDIIAVDYSNGELCFVEVKTRTSSLFGEPQDAVDYRKKEKIFKTALHFFQTSTQKHPSIWRSDVIAVKLDAERRFAGIEHFKNIFNG